MERDKIIRLIAEDIKHNSLLNGLNSIGLTDSDRHTLSIDLLVADILGYPKGKVPDMWLETYHQTMFDTSNNITPKEAYSRAAILFDALTIINE